MNPASRAVHAGRGDKAATGGRRPLAPDLSTAAVHVYEDLDDYDAVARGEKPGHYYGRNSNSNRAMLEEAVAELEGAHGREVKTTGDGVLAVFEGPATALRCAAAIRAAANRQGLQIRAGIHVGEVESAGSDIHGVAVHEAARVMAASNPDEILVSETTRALSLANDLEFADRGEHHLKGFEGPRRLYAYVEAKQRA